MLAAQNAIASLSGQIPVQDEVLVLDVGATADSTLAAPFRGHEWCTYSSCLAARAEQQSYTFGLNATMASLKAPILFVWRTDYVYPPDLVGHYLRSLERAWFAAPYDVLVGLPGVDSSFVRSHFDRLNPFDTAFWAEKSKRVSLYETQDPALFAIRRALWDRLGGLNHQLWGYGWQFAEFGARVQAGCPSRHIDFFQCAPPLHQTHQRSNMHEPAEMRAEAEAGIRRLTDFLGGETAYRIYRLKQLVPAKR